MKYFMTLYVLCNKVNSTSPVIESHEAYEPVLLPTKEQVKRKPKPLLENFFLSINI